MTASRRFYAAPTGLANGRMLVLIAWFCGILAGCAGEDLGEPCIASSECSSQLCYANLCLDPAGDDDGDGLDNATEHRLGTHPRKADSDEDGKSDRTEIGPDPAVPLDRDGDGLIDAVESQSRDTDLDCLPDELDADNTTPNNDPALLAREVCSQEGVCAGQAAKISASCQIGVGTLTCGYSQVPDWSAVEICDGIDNDCDGATDEGHSYQGTDVGQPCQGEGACGEGVVQCRQGRAACSTNPGGSAAESDVERCNGVDDDCDGETDEGFGLGDVPVGVPCLGTGECGVGKVVCGADGVARCSTDPGGSASQATVELCNGLDDDCDGVTDDHIELAGVPIGGGCQGRGACGAGKVVCDAKGEVICSSNPEGPDSQAKAETCNGLDDNCNGETDEGFSWQGANLGAECSGVGGCGGGKVVCGAAGKATCSTQPGAPGVAPKVETCDGTDDDCDGETDEGFVWQGKTLGQSCSGEGICGVGIVECSAKGQVTCSSNADGSNSEAVAEACNGQDDDCDGLVDEDVPPAGAVTCLAVGICAQASGKQTCVGGAWSCAFPSVSGYQGPDETTCDGLDNDCDGYTDEGLSHTWASAPVRIDSGAPAPRFAASAASGVDATEFCVAGGLVARANSDQPGSPGELWCLEPQQPRWRLVTKAPTLARLGAALVAVPAGWSGSQSGPAWWLLGGLSLTGGGQPAIAVDPKTGAVTTLKDLPAGFPSGVGLSVDAQAPRAYVRGDSLWLLALDRLSAANSPGIQRLNRKSGLWSMAKQVPQLTAKAITASCQDSAGGLWVYAVDGLPTAVASTAAGIVGSLWHLAPGAIAWQPRAAPQPPTGWQALWGGQLICEPAPGEIWLHGGRTSGSKSALGLRRYGIKSDTWTVPGLDVTPKITSAYGARVGKSVVLAWGQTKAGLSEAVWSVSQGGGWQVLHPAPKPVIGARWLRTASGLVRVGGVGFGQQLHTTADRPVWRRKNTAKTAWQRLPLPPSQALKAGRAWPLVVPVGPGKLLIWGGVTELPAPATAALAAAAKGLVPSPGAVRLDLNTGKWTLVPATQAALLPNVRTGAVWTHGMISGGPSAWVFGVPKAGGVPKLWQVNPLTLATQVRWQGKGSGPTIASGAALLWDTQADRLLHISAPSGLQVWSFALSGPSQGSWKKIAEDVTAASGAVVILGDLSIDDPLVAILPDNSGAKSALRRLDLSGKAAFVSVTLPPPTWRASAQAVWTTEGAIIALGYDSAGLARPGLQRWPRACSP